MASRPYRLLTCLLGMVLLMCTEATASPLRFQTLTIEDGLAQNSVTTITQDENGFLWLGSQDGLNRYDGHRFVVFKNDPNDATSLPGNYVTTLLPAGRGDVWVGTRFEGLARFTARSGRFTQVPLAYGDGARDTRFVVFRLARHAGVLWAATDRGLARYDETADVLRLEPLPGAQAFPEVRALLADRDALWLGGVGRLLHRHDGDFDILRLPEPDLTVQALARDADGRLHVATQRGLLRQADHGGLERIPDLPAALFSTLTTDPDGGFWAGGRAGVFHRQRDASGWTHYVHDAHNPASIGQDIVFDIFTSRDGVLWIGTYGGGLSRALLSQRHFGLQQWNNGAEGGREYGQERSLSNNIVFPLYEDSSGIVWIGTYNDGLNRWDRERDTWRHFRHDPADPRSLSDNEVRALLEDSDGRLWVGTHGGLDRLDPGADGFTRYRHDPDDPASLSHERVTALFIDSRARFWVGTWGGGLNRFHPETGRFERFPAGSTTLARVQVADITEGPEGDLWIGTSGDGLYRFDPDNGEIRRFVHDDAQADSLSDNSVNSLWFEGATYLWIGTANGLDRLSLADGRFRHFRERDGLSNNLVLGILGDRDGYLWISTNRGLSRFDPATETFRTYRKSDGLQSDEYNSFAYFRNSRGELFFGGIEGFNVFDPRKVERRLPPPPVHITGFTLFNTPVEPQRDDPEALLQAPAGYAENVRLDYRQNLFSVEFAAPVFKDPERNRFAYRLRGFNEDWIETGADKPFATFTNLDPGRYVFEVRAANPGGVWSEESAQLGIVVQPPWWRTAPAYLFYGLFLAALAWLIFQYQRKRLEVRYLAGEKNAAEEATRLKSSFLALMSHEIRTPMNGVLGMVQLLARTRLSRRQRGYVEALEKSGESLLTILDDVLDFSRIEADVIEFESVAFDPREIIESVVLLLGPRAREKGLALAFHADTLPAAVRGDPTRLRQVLMNLVSNAIKFTQAGGVTLRAVTEPLDDGRARITYAVEDTGIGISLDRQAKLFEAFVQADSTTQREYGGTGLGLSICKRLVEMQDGEIGVDSAPGVGSRFWFVLEYELAAPPPRVENATVKPGRVLRVLLVEDQSINREVARGLLEHEGHAVSTAPDGATALQLISEREFDVALMDIHMPGMDGREAARRIRAFDDPVKASIPILGLTASISADDVSACLAAGMNKVLRKPLPASRLVQALAQLDSEVYEPDNDEEQLVDAAMLAQHREILGDERFEEILATFRHTIATLVDAIEVAAQSGDDTAIRRDAHRLGGAAGSMGCSKLAAAAARVEQGLAEPDSLRSLYRSTEFALQSIAPEVGRA